jgi:hypothetical protein
MIFFKNEGDTMKIQFTLTSPEAKRLIAEGVRNDAQVSKTLREGRILLKGGTTVSAISELLSGKPLRISGMITPKGTLTSRFKNEIPLPHSAILVHKKMIPLETREDWEREAKLLTPQDLVIAGANAIDRFGNAVTMAGSWGGGNALSFLHNLFLEGIPFLIVAGLEKLAPGNLLQAIPFAGRKTPDLSYGMAVGLMPLFGRIFTEIEALQNLAKIKVYVIGKGGIHGAEGGTTFLAEGPRKEILKIDALYQKIKGSELSGVPRNLIPCARGSQSCGSHLKCLYKIGLRK